MDGRSIGELERGLAERPHTYSDPYAHGPQSNIDTFYSYGNNGLASSSAVSSGRSPTARQSDQLYETSMFSDQERFSSSFLRSARSSQQAPSSTGNSSPRSLNHFQSEGMTVSQPALSFASDYKGSRPSSESYSQTNHTGSYSRQRMTRGPQSLPPIMYAGPQEHGLGMTTPDLWSSPQARFDSHSNHTFTGDGTYQAHPTQDSSRDHFSGAVNQQIERDPLTHLTSGPMQTHMTSSSNMSLSPPPSSHPSAFPRWTRLSGGYLPEGNAPDPMMVSTSAYKRAQEQHLEDAQRSPHSIRSNPTTYSTLTSPNTHQMASSRRLSQLQAQETDSAFDASLTFSSYALPPSDSSPWNDSRSLRNSQDHSGAFPGFPNGQAQLSHMQASEPFSPTNASAAHLAKSYAGNFQGPGRASRRAPSIHGYPDRRAVESRSRAARFSHPSQASILSDGGQSQEQRYGLDMRSGFHAFSDKDFIKSSSLAKGHSRRADPSGGMLSPLKALTLQLPETYRICDPNFHYQSSLNPRRVLTKPSKGVKNSGYDNANSDYILFVNDILGESFGHRYLVLDVLGQGTFGQVVKCQNMKSHELVAVKVIKNKPAYYRQSMMEATLLELLNNAHPDEQDHILRLHDFFVHRNHLCLVFELLSINLYELLKQNAFRGLGTPLVNIFTKQILDCLCVLSQDKLIHCDLKPENVLLMSLETPQIKVIDFGSACHERQTVYTYIQSRFYRSPEVLLGMPYSSAIDMWSLGCIVAELFLGLPLFPGNSEYNQVARIIEMLGMPPGHMIERGKNSATFFNCRVDEYGKRHYQLKPIEQYAQEKQVDEQPSKRYFSTNSLPELIRSYTLPKKAMDRAEMAAEMNAREALIDFIQGCLNLNPLERWSPQQSKTHPFVTGKQYTKHFVPEMFIVSMPQTQNKPLSQSDVSGKQSSLTLSRVPQANAVASSAIFAAQAQLNKFPEGTPLETLAQLAQKSAMLMTSGMSNNVLNSGGTVYNPQQRSDGSVGTVKAVNAPQRAYANANRPRASTIGKVDRVPPQLQRLAANLRPEGIGQEELSRHRYYREDPFHEMARRSDQTEGQHEQTDGRVLRTNVPLLSQWGHIYDHPPPSNFSREGSAMQDASYMAESNYPQVHQ